MCETENHKKRFRTTQDEKQQTEEVNNRTTLQNKKTINHTKAEPKKQTASRSSYESECGTRKGQPRQDQKTHLFADVDVRDVFQQHAAIGRLLAVAGPAVIERACVKTRL